MRQRKKKQKKQDQRYKKEQNSITRISILPMAGVASVCLPTN